MFVGLNLLHKLSFDQVISVFNHVVEAVGYRFVPYCRITVPTLFQLCFQLCPFFDQLCPNSAQLCFFAELKHS